MRRLMMYVRSSLDDCDELMCPSGVVNLNLDQQLRLNRFKLNRRLIGCRHVPPRVI